MAWKFNHFTGALSYYEPGDEPGPHTHVEDDITDLSHLAIGELSTNAYRGDLGKTAYDHSQAAHADTDADNTAANETSHADVLVDGDVGVSVAAEGHNHDGTYSASGHDHDGTYEPADEDIQTHITSEHAPSNADNTAANETSHADVLVDGDVGVSVAAQAHNHDASYSATGHNHDDDYSAIDHDHDADYSAIGHDHDADYSPIGAATTSTKIDDFAAPDDNTDLNASTTAHGLCPKGDNDTDHFLRGDLTWATPAGGGGSLYELVKCKGNLSSASFANAESALVWNSPAIGSGSSNVSISGSEITIDTAGTYKFTVALRTDSNNRTELFVKTYIDTGGGLTEDTDEIVSDYVSRDADQDTGAVTLITALELDAEDVVEFRGEGDTDGTCVGLDAGTILLIERVA
jgi:hypothetical protein